MKNSDILRLSKSISAFLCGILLLGVSGVLSGCQVGEATASSTPSGTSQASDNVSSNATEYVEIAMLPSPPRYKNITGAADQKAVRDFVEAVAKAETEQGEPEAGWEVMISFHGEEESTVTFCGNKMNLNGTIYLIDETVISQFRTLYDSLDYPETDYPEMTAR